MTQNTETKHTQNTETKPVQQTETKPVQNTEAKPVQQTETKPVQNTESKIMQKTALTDALSALMKDYAIYAPTGVAERHAFARLDVGGLGAVNLEGTPFIPPKELLFPRSETLFGIDTDTGDVSAPGQAGQAAQAAQAVHAGQAGQAGQAGLAEEEGRVALFGARPCDARSIVNLDHAFLEKGYVDSAYAERRKGLTIISLACARIPSPACFCDSMGGGPADAEGSDVLLTEAKNGKAWFISFLTEKGKAVETVWQEAGVLSSSGRTAAAAPPACTLDPGKPENLAEKLTAAFEAPEWERFSEACLGCGTCSYICPTCYCFDIDSEMRGKTAEEFRCWDSCMFSDYSRIAGGYNPRPTKKERLRNRYLHKLAYFDESHGRTLCVGCGRCIIKCPAGLDIASVIEWGGTL